jgi:hypothetical protein
MLRPSTSRATPSSVGSNPGHPLARRTLDSYEGTGFADVDLMAVARMLGVTQRIVRVGMATGAFEPSRWLRYCPRCMSIVYHRVVHQRELPVQPKDRGVTYASQIPRLRPEYHFCFARRNQGWLRLPGRSRRSERQSLTFLFATSFYRTRPAPLLENPTFIFCTEIKTTS